MEVKCSDCISNMERVNFVSFIVLVKWELNFTDHARQVKFAFVLHN